MLLPNLQYLRLSASGSREEPSLSVDGLVLASMVASRKACSKGLSFREVASAASGLLESSDAATWSEPAFEAHQRCVRIKLLASDSPVKATGAILLGSRRTCKSLRSRNGSCPIKASPNTPFKTGSRTRYFNSFNQAYLSILSPSPFPRPSLCSSVKASDNFFCEDSFSFYKDLNRTPGLFGDDLKSPSDSIELLSSPFTFAESKVEIRPPRSRLIFASVWLYC